MAKNKAALTTATDAWTRELRTWIKRMQNLPAKDLARIAEMRKLARATTGRIFVKTYTVQAHFRRDVYAQPIVVPKRSTKKVSK